MTLCKCHLPHSGLFVVIQLKVGDSQGRPGSFFYSEGTPDIWFRESVLLLQQPVLLTPQPNDQEHSPHNIIINAIANGLYYAVSD